MKYTLLTIFLVASLAAPACAETSGGIDWSAWQRLPVLHDGRIMPLDTVAKIEVTKICGTATPQIGMLGARSEAETSALSPSEKEKIISAGQPRRFSAPELLYAWTVDPEKWESVPFIHADDEALRKDVLGVPIFGEDGSRLKFVSPRQILTATKFWKQIEDFRRQQEDDPKAQHTPLETKVKELYEALETYEQLTFDPSLPGMGRRAASESMGVLVQEWFGLQQDLPRLPIMQQPGMAATIEEANEAVRAMGSAWLAGENSRDSLLKIEPLAARVQKATTALANRVADEIGTPATDSNIATDPLRVVKRNLVDRTASVARLAIQFHWNMFDSGGSLRVVPSMEPSALEADRHRSEVQPWAGLPAVLYGSTELLHDYPTGPIEAARKAWQETRTAYADRDNPRRAESFAEAMQHFAAALRNTSDRIEPERQRLKLKEYDRFLIAKTAYPPVEVIDAEVVYNQTDPFFWAWCVALVSASMLAMSLMAFRKPLFWCGTAALSMAIGCIVAGFLLRMFITRWAPVTSMHETIVWVTMCVSLLTLWATFLPMLGPSSRLAWRLTSIPGSWEPGPENGTLLGNLSMPLLAMWRCLALLTRVGVMLIAMYVAGVFPTSGETTGYHLVALMPPIDIGSMYPNLSASLVWAASLFVACTLIWFIPRIVPTAIASIPISFYRAAKEDCYEPMERVYRARPVALAGAMAATFAALIANYAPSFPHEIHALMPVLRSNFWLGIHVLTIVSSYAGAATAWAIGNAALANYLFGSYRLVPSTRNNTSNGDAGNSVADSKFGVYESQGYERRPPAICGTLASLNYRVIQITVLLLTAGTILGGLWADVSWGRFWGWDPKETWALNSLLVYLIVLHGRRIGWPGDLSLAVGSIVAFTSILWAWYGVNFLMAAGLHSYGAGEGGQWLLFFGVVGLNWVFAFMAVLRAVMER